MTESKEWVTIKIPKEIREEAREDSRTYGEIMEDGLDTPTSQGQSIPSSVENNTVDVDTDALRTAIREELSKHETEKSNREPPRDVDFSPVLNRIDDLQAQLPKDVANEVQR